MHAIDPAFVNLLALALGAIFVTSGVMKLGDLELFESAVANYRLLPRLLEKPFAWTLPLVECACAAGMLFAATRAAAASMLILLLAMFAGAIAINLARGRRDIDCGCFGPALRQGLSGWLLARNFVLMMFAAIAALPVSARPILWLDVVTIGMGATTLIILYASANVVLGNAPRTRALEML
jgi:uncharacterized membrane protein YphA (DoxX/SURF4 family)